MDDGDNDVENFIPHSLRRNYTPKRNSQRESLHWQFKSPEIPSRCKPLTRNQLSSEQISAILQAVKTENWSF